jgi:hypothetical protein
MILNLLNSYFFQIKSLLKMIDYNLGKHFLYLSFESIVCKKRRICSASILSTLNTVIKSEPYLYRRGVRVRCLFQRFSKYPTSGKERYEAEFLPVAGRIPIVTTCRSPLASWKSACKLSSAALTLPARPARLQYHRTI